MQKVLAKKVFEKYLKVFEILGHLPYFGGRNKEKNISKCCLLKLLPNVLIISCFDNFKNESAIYIIYLISTRAQANL